MGEENIENQNITKIMKDNSVRRHSWTGDERLEVQDKNKKRNRQKDEENSDKDSNEEGKSPDAKKGRREQFRKMEVINELNEESKTDQVMKIIEKLCEETENKEIKELISCFNDYIFDNRMQVKQNMIETSNKWEDGDRVIKLAIEFVENRDREIIEEKVEELTERLIDAIENRMIKKCNDCSYWYSVKRDDIPTMHCTLCQVGMHDCRN